MVVIRDTHDMHQFITTVFSLLPTVCFFSLQLSGTKTIAQILRTGSTGSLSLFPFLAMVLNGFVWTSYGIIVHDWAIIFPNLTCFLFGTFYVAVFSYYTSHNVSYHLLFGALFMLSVGLSVLLYDDNRKFVGYLACTVAVVFLSSPLAALGTVIKERSTRSMPFLTSFTTWLNASAWFIFGYFLRNDAFIYVPNALGVIASSMQLLLFLVYASQPAGEMVARGRYDTDPKLSDREPEYVVVVGDDRQSKVRV
mmetsp:Transcript_8142/g.30029  ORF Transcript_8142/g.30029 Transcript_8142/m.30029 type:complete len:252 (+) Transcript_8142:221-976(+)|eukprot:scaffold3886_cov399-Prasinococcus_capsulatus_cf.AAC.29